jgi:NAD(P)-dependent dehydrogenase (short-subunit alcohol dehydrogenase family)
MRLENKVALITGGTSGIGEAVAELFAREGAKVAITGRNESRGHAVTACILQSGGKAIFLRTDVRKSAECQRAVDETLRSFGRLDILFNNAGVFFPQTALECSEEEWDLQIDINLKGTFLMSKYALGPMIAHGGGVIINNSSGWGLVGGVLRLERRSRSAYQSDGRRSRAAGHPRELHLPGQRGHSDAAGGCATARLGLEDLSGGLRESAIGANWDRR